MIFAVLLTLDSINSDTTCHVPAGTVDVRRRGGQRASVGNNRPFGGRGPCACPLRAACLLVMLGADGTDRPGLGTLLVATQRFASPAVRWPPPSPGSWKSRARHPPERPLRRQSRADDRCRPGHRSRGGSESGPPRSDSREARAAFAAITPTARHWSGTPGCESPVREGRGHGSRTILPQVWHRLIHGRRRGRRKGRRPRRSASEDVQQNGPWPTMTETLPETPTEMPEAAQLAMALYNCASRADPNSRSESAMAAVRRFARRAGGAYREQYNRPAWCETYGHRQGELRHRRFGPVICSLQMLRRRAGPPVRVVRWAPVRVAGGGWSTWLPTPRWHRRSAAGAAGRCRTVRLPAVQGIR
jgi:hypothetical protein